MTTDDDDRTIRPFADFLRDQARGATHEELSETLQRLVDRVQDTRKPGTLVLTIRVEPLKNSADMVSVTDQIKAKFPEHDRDGSYFFVDQDSNLRRDNPNQLAMRFEPLAEVPAPPPGVNPETGEVTDVTATEGK